MLGITTRGASCPPHGPRDNHLLPVGTSGQGRRPPGQPGQMSPTSLMDGCRTLGEKDGAKPSWVSREAGISPAPQASSQAPVSCCPRVIDLPHSPSEVEAEQEGSTTAESEGRGGPKRPPPAGPGMEGWRSVGQQAREPAACLCRALLEARSGARVCSSLKSQALKWQRKSVF